MTLNMQGTHKTFFKHVVDSDLTGEQLRVLAVLLSHESDGDMCVFQNEIAHRLGMAESNVSRSIKALIAAAIIEPVSGELHRPPLHISQSGDGCTKGGFIKGTYFRIARKFSCPRASL